MWLPDPGGGASPTDMGLANRAMGSPPGTQGGPHGGMGLPLGDTLS